MTKPMRPAGWARLQAIPACVVMAWMRSISIFTFACMLVWTGASVGASVGAAATAVDLELVLAVDVSGSIDKEEAELQRRGYIDALSDPAVVQAVTSGRHGRIALAYVEWAGLDYYRVVVGWREIADLDGARAFARQIAVSPLFTAQRTSISNAIVYSIPMFDNNGFDGTRRVIDISGDGPNNYGPLVTVARDQAVARGITINGLPIMNDRPNPWGFPTTKDLDLYYANCVIGGPGAFLVVAESFRSFAGAIRTKLVREIAGGSAPDAGRPGLLVRVAGHAGPPCDVGEKQWDNFIRDRNQF